MIASRLPGIRTRQCSLAAAVVAMVWCVMPSPTWAAGVLASADTAIESGREALSGSPKIPWYDSATDDFRAAKVKPPRPPRQRSNFDIFEFLMWCGWFLLAVLLVTLVYFIAKSFLKHEVKDSIVVSRDHVGADISRVDELPVALKKSPADFLDEARRLYSKGDYAQAIVYLFSHQLLQLDRRHWIRLVKGKTNRQYLREVRRSASPSADTLADIFHATVLTFEEVFFGKRLPPRESIDAVWQKIDLFEMLVSSVEEQAA